MSHHTPDNLFPVDGKATEAVAYQLSMAPDAKDLVMAKCMVELAHVLSITDDRTDASKAEMA